VLPLQGQQRCHAGAKQVALEHATFLNWRRKDVARNFPHPGKRKKFSAPGKTCCSFNDSSAATPAPREWPTTTSFQPCWCSPRFMMAAA